MLDELDSEQFSRWQAFFQLEPWGGAREDLRAGLLASLHHNAWFKGANKRPDDWFPNLKSGDPDEPTQTPQQAAAKAKAWVQAQGGEVR